MEAARCLERGGLWTEAVALYEELAEFEKAGDLCRRLEQEDAAVAFYERAVIHHRGNRVLVAAAILVGKLDRPDEALALLDAAWPYSGQAGECLRESFRLRGQLGRHEESQLRLRHLREDVLSPLYLTALVESLADAATVYPDRDVRHVAADTVRLKAAAGLAAGGAQDAERLLRAIERVAPEDRLLPRDCRRFAQRMASGSRAPVRPTRGVARLRRVGPAFVLPARIIELHAAVQSGDMIYLVARRADRGALLVRCNAALNCEWEVMHGWPPLEGNATLLLATTPSGGDRLVVHVVGQAPLAIKRAFLDPSLGGGLDAGGLPGLSPNVLGLTRPSPGNTWAAASDGPGLVLLNLGPGGEVVETRQVWGAAWREPFGLIPLHAWEHSVYLGCRDHLVVVSREQHAEWLPVPGVIERMAGSAPHTKSRLLLGLAQGVLVFEARDRSQHLLAADHTSPVSAFVGNGLIAIASVAGLEVYQPGDASYVLRAELPGSRPQPLALLPTAHAGRFAVVAVDGQIEWFQA
jgi:hypothetical protein